MGLSDVFVRSLVGTWRKGMLGIRVKWTDRIRLVSYEVVEPVSSGGIDEAIPDPFRRFHSIREDKV
jgi:hypothetical protein